MPDGTRPPATWGSPPRISTLRLRILATTDLHMHLGAERRSGGLARIAPVICAERRQFDNVLLFDNGDLIEGTPLAEEIARAGLGPHDVHPAIAALNRLKFDAATLGNHDFAHGTEFLRRVLRDAQHPVTLANAGLMNGAAIWSESVILPRRMRDAEGRMHDLSIGVFGVAPPQTVEWEADLARDLSTEDVVIAAHRAVSSLRARGADVIIALSHGGHGNGPSPRAENAAGVIARIDGVDAVIAGHTHEVIVRAAKPGRAPIVKAGYAGSHLAAITLSLHREADGWRTVFSSAEALAAADTPHPDFADTLHSATAAVARRLSMPIGFSTRPLHSHYALLGVDNGLRLIDAAARAWLDEAMPENSLPVLSAVAPFRTGGRGGPENFVTIPAGPLSLGDLSALYPFTNHIAAIEMSGAEITEWLERAAAIFSWHSDAEVRNAGAVAPVRPLIDPDFAGFQFDILTGLDYGIDLSRPPAFDAWGHALPNPGRLRHVRHLGQPLRPDARFLMLTNSYRLTGTPLYAPLTRHRTCRLPGPARIRMRDIVARYLKRADLSGLPDAPLFSFHAPDGARFSFETSAEARVADCPLPVESAAMTSSGFKRLILRF
ncbi:bifunctional 2',3'-cyclic-nucleotide 2'-phosphodiesterase/3'-nucleotidase [Paracoccus aurantiacus]|uniref:Bifunctional 2',3'-cyclic-nucleotide 2'-phosphodiesterase/3'-nucleotidase n=1 Tax=Paracoccus aurantiacus TaxID=2599412 RepID=A0A5C6S935_9RHOB|nr:5'-nucleotidase C-terminal domain-containing protein [Paracoccus aurantiacus]TXB71047.1 bifunctional 2',3'-cyclic-nucleotide 2'-phosphodiesterase/3'-nucleotidase [Paracoccus aurantiacus]